MAVRRKSERHCRISRPFKVRFSRRVAAHFAPPSAVRWVRLGCTPSELMIGAPLTSGKPPECQGVRQDGKGSSS